MGYLDDHPDLELVGVRCYSEEKEGKDAGELVGLAACGVQATRDVDALTALDADCVIFCPRSALSDHTAPDTPERPWVQELLAILESGKNVVSSIGSPMHWRHLADGEAFLGEITDACRRGRSTAFFTGIDPGFSESVLGVSLGSLVGKVTQIRTWEMIDYGTYMAAETIAALGFGHKPEDMPQSTAPLMATWGCSPWVVADACGFELDDIAIDGDVWISDETYTAANGLTVEAGTVGAVRWSLTGMVNGRPLVQINHVNRLGPHTAPDWPSIGDAGGYRVEVDGFPPVRGDFPFGLAGGTGDGLKDAMAMTAARLINSIGTVVDAAPGYVTANDLPLIGPRHAFASRD
jgi:4-hydroxy-tetrahydrodipicolinate reductase